MLQSVTHRDKQFCWTLVLNKLNKQTEQKVYSHLICSENVDLCTDSVTVVSTLSCAADTFNAILTDHTQTRLSYTEWALTIFWEEHTELIQYISLKSVMLQVILRFWTCSVRHCIWDHCSRDSLSLILSLKDLRCERLRSFFCHYNNVTLLLLIIVCIEQHNLVNKQIALIVVERRRRRSTVRCHHWAECHWDVDSLHHC